LSAVWSARNLAASVTGADQPAARGRVHLERLEREVPSDARADDPVGKERAERRVERAGARLVAGRARRVVGLVVGEAGVRETERCEQ
jgi:hypothetical protein